MGTSTRHGERSARSALARSSSDAARRERRGGRAALGLVTWTAAACVLGAGRMSAQESASSIESARAALEKWVETRRILSKEQRDWELGREILVDRIELVRRENEALRARIAEAEASIAEADRKRAGLFDENEGLKQAAASLEGTILRLEARLGALLGRLPDPIRERVKPLSRRLPEQGTETKLSLGERFQNVVGILNEIDKFQREISVTSEVRTLGDGSSAEVKVLYVGLGSAYYVSADGRAGGMGSASEDAWAWQPADQAAAAISAAIAILGNERVAEFVRLPSRIE